MFAMGPLMHSTTAPITMPVPTEVYKRQPLSRGECNLLYSVAEATLLCSILQLNHVRVMADTYHMAMEHESMESLAMACLLYTSRCV